MMIEQKLSFQLPKPWSEKKFELDRFGSITFLVGPNGSGKTKFADALKGVLPNCRLLGTDRLHGTGRDPMAGIWGDRLEQGFQKKQFANFKNAGAQGSGIDAFIILEERPDLRIEIEATLSALFGREISLEWDSGNLTPMATARSTGDAYRVDRDECHGIRELLVLLTHLYNNQHGYLIVDEPELNLHPQFQSFFMQEVRKVAGPPERGTRKKGVFLITHSPFIVDLRSMDDLRSVISFSSDHSVPRHMPDLDQKACQRLESLIPRLNVHHKQLFFSDNPVFVEGVLDAQLLEAVQERRGVSTTAAGSCIIDVGGCEEVNKYVEFCRGFSKSGYFVYDLDSLFSGTLRQCIRADGATAEFLAALGLGNDFSHYCGELDRELTKAIRAIQSAKSPGRIQSLQTYIVGLGELSARALPRARVAVLIELAAREECLAQVISAPLVASIKGRLNRVIELLKEKNIFVLKGGALEHYLPSYCGDAYELNDAAKRKAIESEIKILSSGMLDNELEQRYGELFNIVSALPAKPPVDLDGVLRMHLGDYIHQLQKAVLNHPDWSVEQLNRQLSARTTGWGKLFQVKEFERGKEQEFHAVVEILGSSVRAVRVSDKTNAGMRQFVIDAVK